MSDARELVRDALGALGIRRLMLAIHDAALPGDARDDAGRGAPLSLGGRAFLEFAAGLGFHGLQLGPQGETTEHDQSPYDAAIFSRSTLSLALRPLVEEGLLSEETFAAAVAQRPPGAERRAAHRQVHAVARRVLDEAFARFEERRPEALAERLREFAAEHAAWLERDALYAALCPEHDQPDWLRWPEGDRDLWKSEAAQAERRSALALRHARLLERYRLAQLFAHEQHAAFRAEARRLGLLLYGDLQIGVSHQDVWSWGALFLSGWRMGAPPSRTNPEGQPWSYAVLDPDRYGSSGAALAFLRMRLRKLLDEFDGVRVDHPHGLIDPWVYRAAQPDPLAAVQRGTRLFSSPDVSELAALAICRTGQIDRSQPRHADGWVRELSEEQVARYATLFDAVIAAAREHGRDPADVACEVLSTQPYPVARVLARHGLGRFRVTQKVVLADPQDVYRSENAAPQDWVMTGNHDTPSIWTVAERWCANGSAAAHAACLAGRLLPEESSRPRWTASVAADPAALARAKLHELFVGPARNVMVSFTDLLGLREQYNVPGTISERNWSLRVPPDFAGRYPRDCREGRALDLPRALATAFRARGADFCGANAALLRQLERVAGPDVST